VIQRNASREFAGNCLKAVKLREQHAHVTARWGDATRRIARILSRSGRSAVTSARTMRPDAVVKVPLIA
jgi:hypothetical protein